MKDFRRPLFFDIQKVKPIIKKFVENRTEVKT